MYLEQNTGAAGGEPQEHPTCSDDQPRTLDLRFADPLIAEIKVLCTQRRGFHKAEKALILQAKAMARGFCGGDKKEAERLYKLVDGLPDADVSAGELAFLLPFLSARDTMCAARKSREKTLKRLAKQLPIFKWSEGVRGFGPLGLALIVGEAGDLSQYRNVSGVWKRLGLGVIDGERQRLRAGISQEEALRIGYNPERRAVAWVLSDSMLKAQGKEERAGPYRKIYDQRKAMELLKPEVEKDSVAHARAMRYMFKCFIRDFTVAWREVNH